MTAFDKDEVVKSLAEKKEICNAEVASTCGSTADDGASSSTEEELTTIIFRNISTSCTREKLTEVLDAEGFRGSYDFIHVPVKFHNLECIGYGLVNMVDQDAGERILEHFKDYSGSLAAVEGDFEVAWSRPLQGLAAHIDRYRDSPVMHDSVPQSYKPALYQDGAPVAFPEPTQKIRAPRIRHIRAVTGSAN